MESDDRGTCHGTPIEMVHVLLSAVILCYVLSNKKREESHGENREEVKPGRLR